jgi:hypothetical protein
MQRLFLAQEIIEIPQNLHSKRRAQVCMPSSKGVAQGAIDLHPEHASLSPSSFEQACRVPIWVELTFNIASRVKHHCERYKAFHQVRSKVAWQTSSSIHGDRPALCIGGSPDSTSSAAAVETPPSLATDMAAMYRHPELAVQRVRWNPNSGCYQSGGQLLWSYPTYVRTPPVLPAQNTEAKVSLLTALWLWLAHASHAGLLVCQMIRHDYDCVPDLT